ncbi:AAA family ATPase [Stutzerimonas stutzeri]|uniref:AAA family ATPase n=1 Tax=Stutzerimonas stutzeri TaxID=316 RepID=UPI0017861BA9|nr:AAA family ATPase [Stutzerimonas stutzeri]MBD9412128.1 AAA family ATPase [Stutzerimonas stutzeri]
MKLIHVYIAAHKSVRDLNVSLAGTAKCFVEDNYLEIRRRRDTSDYYHGYHCSAIIGANGVGKSSVLDFIESCYFLTDSSGLLVFFDEVDENLHVCTINLELLGCSENVILRNDYESFAYDNHIELVKINNVSDAQSRLGYDKKIRHPLIQNRSLEHYTRQKPGRKKYFDNLLRYFKWRAEPDSLIDDVGFEFNFYDAKEKAGKYLRLSELKSEPYIAYSAASEKVELHIDTYFSEPWRRLEEYLLYLNISPLLMDISAEVKGELKKYIPSFLHYYFIISLEAKRKSVVASLRSAIEALRYPENWNIFTASEIKEIYLSTDLDIETMHERLNLVESLLSDICSHFEDSLWRLTAHRGISFLIDDFYHVSEIIGLANNFSRGILSNISWGWRGISTGEMAKSHLLSETYDCLKSTNNRNYIIVIDEADLYLHPEWQRNFLDSYLALLKDIEFEDIERRAQLVITTHSPIIVSDFLPQDIVSLIKDADGSVQLTDSFGFGTNITNLFIDGMHVTSTFGEHSRKAIAALMEKSEQGVLSDQDKVLIGEIGNKYVREFLLKND